MPHISLHYESWTVEFLILIVFHLSCHPMAGIKNFACDEISTKSTIVKIKLNVTNLHLGQLCIVSDSANSSTSQVPNSECSLLQYDFPTSQAPNYYLFYWCDNSVWNYLLLGWRWSGHNSNISSVHAVGTLHDDCCRHAGSFGYFAWLPSQ